MEPPASAERNAAALARSVVVQLSQKRARPARSVHMEGCPGCSCSTRALPEPRALKQSNNEAQKAPLAAPLQSGADAVIERLMNGRDVWGTRENGDLTVFEFFVGTAIVDDSDEREPRSAPHGRQENRVETFLVDDTVHPCRLLGEVGQRTGFSRVLEAHGNGSLADDSHRNLVLPLPIDREDQGDTIFCLHGLAAPRASPTSRRYVGTVRETPRKKPGFVHDVNLLWVIGE